MSDVEEGGDGQRRGEKELRSRSRSPTIFRQEFRRAMEGEFPKTGLLSGGRRGRISRAPSNRKYGKDLTIRTKSNMP